MVCCAYKCKKYVTFVISEINDILIDTFCLIQAPFDSELLKSQIYVFCLFCPEKIFTKKIRTSLPPAAPFPKTCLWLIIFICFIVNKCLLDKLLWQRWLWCALDDPKIKDISSLNLMKDLWPHYQDDRLWWHIYHQLDDNVIKLRLSSSKCYFKA